MGSQTAAGSSLALSAMLPSSFDAAGYAALTYVEIGQVEKLGSFGASFAKVEFQGLKGAKQKFKGSADFGALQPSIALDALDAGQILLQTASDDETQKLYSFRVTFPDGSARYFRGRVFGAPETADGADSMLMATPTVEICSKVVKLEAGVTPTPSPTLSKPSISPTSGAVGTTFTATDGTVANGTITSRRWLLGTTAIGTGTTVTPNAAGSLTRENTAVGTNGETITSTSVAVTVSAATANPAPSLSLSSAVTKAEGNSGTTLFSWTLTLNRDGSTAAYPFTWSTAGSGANPADAADFGGTFPSGSGTFAAGETSKTISVLVAGDTAVEPNDTFTLNVVATGLNTVTSTGTISNDDAATGSTPNMIAASGARIATTSVAVPAGTTYWQEHYASAEGAISEVQFTDIGWYFATSGSGAPFASPGDYTIARTIEYPAGVFTDVTWAGAASKLIASTTRNKSDKTTGVQIPAGAKFWTRTQVISSTANIPACELPAAASVLEVDAASFAGDQLRSGTFTRGTTTTNSRLVGPVAVEATIAKANARAFIIGGDSIAFGQGDVTTAGTAGSSGYPARGIGAAYPYIKLTKPGQYAQYWRGSNAGLGWITDLLANLGYTDVMFQHGINDLSGGSTVSGILSQYAANEALLKSGTRIWQTTILARTDSSNGYADAAGQTSKTDGNMANLSALNDAIRARTGVTIIEAADRDMTARNSNIHAGPFPPALDGVHPTSAKAADIAVAVTAALA